MSERERERETERESERERREKDRERHRERKRVIMPTLSLSETPQNLLEWKPSPISLCCKTNSSTKTSQKYQYVKKIIAPQHHNIEIKTTLPMC